MQVIILTGKQAQALAQQIQTHGHDDYDVVLEMDSRSDMISAEVSPLCAYRIMPEGDVNDL